VLEEIRIADVATYGEHPQRLDGLRQINFLFGTNGSGKTTISRVIADPTVHPSCAVNWRGARPLESLVYNSDFVERNFIPQLRGIFTLGEVEGDTLDKIEEARAKAADIETQIGTLKTTLGALDHSSGKRAELRDLRNAFEEQCWNIKTTHDAHFQGAFAGLRNSRTKFCDRVLEEFVGNDAVIRPVEDLKARARTVFAEGVARLATVPTIDGQDLLDLEQEPVLAKKVVGKEDIDIGSLIRRLGNSDWVRQGLVYAEGPGSPCPFCQKALDEELLAKLNAFFDETYLADIAAIVRAEEAYRTFSDAILATVDAVLASGSPHIDVDKLRPFSDRLRTLITLNKGHIERKRKEPSAPVTLEPLAEPLGAVIAIIEQANREIANHNALVDNLAAERKTLTSEIWKCLTDEKKGIIGEYTTAKSNLDKAIAGISAGIETKTKALTEAQATLADLEKEVTSVQPTVTEINATLASFGFTSFKLATAGEKQQFYAIIRGDGSDARETLSEGERSFITFLYFYHLIRGSTSASGVNVDRIVVFDDPVSSLDSDVLFIVSALIKRVLAEAVDGNGRVKQVFVLTHNIYFHKEVSFDPKRQQGERRTHETFWVVRKAGNATIVEGHQGNPIRTSYELLWAEVRNPNRSNLTIQNVLRRILEHYFTILGNMDKDAVIAKFEGRDQQICASLFSWINDGSHNFADDLYVAADDTTVGRYLSVFRQIFKSTNHGAHYEMMMGPEEAIPAPTEEPVAVAAELVTEVAMTQPGVDGALAAAEVPDARA
jgi:wobble nucleotide-excising tRNase